MATHPPRPYEDEKVVNQRPSPPLSAPHPARPYGTPVKPLGTGVGVGRMGNQKPLGPTPTRVPNISGQAGDDT